MTSYKKVVLHHTIFAGKTYDVILVLYDYHTNEVWCHTKFCLRRIQILYDGHTFGGMICMSVIHIEYDSHTFQSKM
jgi:hypothetical protein